MPASGVEISDGDVRRVSRQATEVVGIRGRDDRPAEDVRRGDEECVDRQLRAGSNAAEQLTGSNSGAGVDRMDLNPLAAEPGEHAGIPRMPPHDFGKYRGDRSDGKLSGSHLGGERSNTVPSGRGPMSNRSNRLAVEEKHQPTFRDEELVGRH